MLKITVKNKPHTFLITAVGEKIPTEIQEIVWNVMQNATGWRYGATIRFTTIADTVIAGRYSPSDWRALRALEELSDAVEGCNGVLDTDDNWDKTILAGVEADKAAHASKLKRATAKRDRVMKNLAARVRKHNLRARNAGLTADLTSEQAEKILKAVQGKCPNCNKNGFAWHDLELSHIVAHVNGGGSTASNFRALCGDCNRNQGATA